MVTNMKIAMIGLKGVPSRAGGIEIHVEEIGKRLVKMGHEVYVYTRPHYIDKGVQEFGGMVLKSIPTFHTKHLDAIVHTFLSSIDSLTRGFDIIHFHAAGPSTMCFIPKLAGRKVVCTIHGLDWKRNKWGRFASAYLRLGERMAAQVSDNTIVVSKTMKCYIKNKYTRDCHYIPNGVNIAQKVKAGIIKESYSLEKDDFFLYLSRLVPEKGAHYLIQAYNKLDTDKKLVIAGGASHSEEYEKFLKALAGDNRGIIFTGHVADRELSELFSNAYTYVLPSEVEGMPIALLEAMSYGQCVIASDIDENVEVMEDKGLSFTSGDIDSLYEMLAYADAHPREVSARKMMAEQYILRKYDWDRISYETEEVYRSVLRHKV